MDSQTVLLHADTDGTLTAIPYANIMKIVAKYAEDAEHLLPGYNVNDRHEAYISIFTHCGKGEHVFCTRSQAERYVKEFADYWAERAYCGGGV